MKRRKLLDHRNTYISPASNDVEHITSADGEVDDAAVDGLGRALGRQVLLGDLHPAQRADGEADGAAPAPLGYVAAGGVAAPPEERRAGVTESGGRGGRGCYWERGRGGWTLRYHAMKSLLIINLDSEIVIQYFISMFCLCV